jgi:eukaryotic-like serine/threonine-protein kinase
MTDTDPGSSERAFVLFDSLVELVAEERAERLAAVGHGDPELAREVAELLAAADLAGDFLERPAVDEVPALAQSALAEQRETPALLAGDQVGVWRLVRPLGAGGMGEVWEVERADGQFDQRAALKLLKRGFDSDEVLRRFRVERQILAHLRHPAIAHLYDGGIAPDGRPFFVMELVAGEPLTVACARRELSIADRLAAMLTVCEAVDTAHHSLVVHRDLKPSNVLMTAGGEIKLLDFGIAKLLSEGEEGTETRAWERLMTPAYAAPEQILGEPVTTATDVYALGTMLYELLTGRLPHRRPAGAARLAEHVEHESVERPSTAVLRSAEDGVDGSTSQPADRRRHARLLRGDLDWIVLRALAREPERRYASASALAADLRRHLTGKPVAARPDSVAYRTGKLVRRHRVAVIAAALVLVSLLAGLAAALWQAREARAQAARAERVKDLLVGVFLGADPEQARGETITARELLAEGTRRVEAELAGEPEVQAELLTTIARVEEGLGLLASAHGRAERALAIAERLYGPRDPRLIPPLAAVGSVLSQLERDAESLAVRERILAIARERFAADSLEVARAETEVINAYFGLDRYAEALPLAEHALAVKRNRLGEEHLDTLRSKLNLAFALDFLDRTDEAIVLGDEVLAAYRRLLGPSDPRTLEAMHNQAVSLAWVGRNEEAVTLFEEAIEGRRRVLGPDDHRLAFSLQQSTLALRALERYAAAESAATEAIGIFRAIDPRHPEATGALHGLGTAAFARGDFAAAEGRYRQTVAEWEAARGSEHRSTLQAKADLALALAALDRTEEAEPLAREALAARERVFGPESTYAAHSRFALGEVLRAAGRGAEAVAELRRARELGAAVFGEAHQTTVRAGVALALAALDSGEPELRAEAEKALDRAAEGQRALDPEHSRMGEIDLARARLTLLAGDAAQAAALAGGARQRLAVRLGAGSPAAEGAARVEATARELVAAAGPPGGGGS